MSKSIVTELSDKQQAVLTKYIEKWKKIAFSTQAIEREKAKLAIKNEADLIADCYKDIITIDQRI